tara:strand:+ start:630 stop:971 length:342 start_codon:yes stop_codon:yes gene_type:complete
MNKYQNAAWFKALKKEVENTSQNKAAKKIGVNASYINAAIQGNSFPGRIDRFIAKIEGALLNQKVMCPVAGEISKDLCQSHQERPWSNANSMTVRLFRACRNGCAHSKLETTT